MIHSTLWPKKNNWHSVERLLSINNLDLLLSPDFQCHGFLLCCRLRVMKCHVPYKISFVPETPATLWALVGLLLGGRWYIGRVMVQILVPFQELLLSEALVTLITLEWLLVCVDQHVGLQMAL